ncbi:MAG: hypothetical protein JWN15_1968, partial [Firmicutes bacterium]|nr:hypothetical protein [Bacillota bacterium]
RNESGTTLSLKTESDVSIQEESSGGHGIYQFILEVL